MLWNYLFNYDQTFLVLSKFLLINIFGKIEQVIKFRCTTVKLILNGINIWCKPSSNEFYVLMCKNTSLYPIKINSELHI